MGSSRRQFLASGARAAALAALGLPLAQACGGGGSASGRKAVKATIKDGLSPEKGPLRIVNYADYVNPDVIADFESTFGVKVEISTIDTDAEMIAKLASGAIKADVNHSMSPTTIGNLINGGLVMPLNPTYLPNTANVVAALQNPWYDTGGAHSVPYTFFGTGIGYRADRVDPATVAEQGWDALWKATGFSGQVSVLDDDREPLAMAMLRRGSSDINTTDPKTIDQALADLTELIDLVSVKVNIEGYKDIPEGTTTLAHTWSADMVTGAINYLPEGTDAGVLGFWHPPADRYIVSNDAMGVMANAESPVLAHLYLNFLLDAAVAEKNFTWTGYLPAIARLDADYVIGAGYVPENLRSCVPTNDEIARGLSYRPLDPAGQALYEAAWSKFTAGG